MGRAKAGFRSKCAACGDRIEEGDPIAKDDDENWVHEGCAESDPRDLRFNLRREERDD